MLQVLQYQKSGEILIEEIPAPNCPAGGILVRNHSSLISAGTEKISVSNTKSSLIARARKQPDQVKMVLDFIKKEGLLKTMRRVQSTLDSYKILGYSSAGVVVESDCDEFSPGDRVACAGAGLANHAEYVAIPRNLAAKIPEGVDFEVAAYTTVGTIALQGVRQSEAMLGETIAVIGLGLIGQITVMLLKAAGCRVIGIDIDESLFAQAVKSGCDATFASKNENIDSIMAFSRGSGCDSVIITASTSSNQPVELAMHIARKKGKVIVVGAVGMNLPRSPFYEKELDFRISCSYGPGRYDASYEKRGIDYPQAYVRWTENRNMQAFLDLVAAGKVKISELTTHKYNIEYAAKAYDLITGKSGEPYLGIVLNYPEREGAFKRSLPTGFKGPSEKELKIAFIGAGSFAKSFLLPPLQKLDVGMDAVTTETPSNAHTIAKQFGFRHCSVESGKIIESKDNNTVFIATRHDTHAGFVLQAIEAGKPVFAEKPLAVNFEQLDSIADAVEKFKGRVMVGFNRRFSKSFRLIKDFYKNRTQPMAISYRVNAGRLPKDHWIFTSENGGRIIGEACHFIDCMVFLTGALPQTVYATPLKQDNADTFNRDNVMITINFSDGSIGTLQYLANGDKSVPKEYCEVFCEQSTAIMNDFRSVELFRAGRKKLYSLNGAKGHEEEVKAFIEAIRDGSDMPISFEEIYNVTAATFAAGTSITTGLPVSFGR